MDPELAARISPEHQRRLAWFEEQAGGISPPPAPLEDGLLLVSTPKGIYKPSDIPYAVSIKIKLDSPYSDGQVLPRPDGGWRLLYHQENADPVERDRAFTNRGLMRCIADQVPVGVLRERERVGRKRTYDVLGLAVPVRWQEGYFFLESLDPDGLQTGDIVNDLLEATAEAEVEQEAKRAPLPTDDYDARLRVYREIVARRGQSGFRSSLLDAYAGKCAVTRCDVVAVLEAAHLRPYRGPASNMISNGLLLRADIHTLFDLRLMAFEPATRRVVLSSLLARTQYETLSGLRLADPVADDQRPPQDSLDKLWQDFNDAEAARLVPRSDTEWADQRLATPGT